MALTKEGYKKRIADDKIEKYLRTFGALSIEGPRWCGKTWTSLNHANSVSYLSDQSTKTLAEINPDSALSGESPHAIDEWQAVPQIWDSVRFAVDQEKTRGRFILTGSVVKPAKDIFHSGIGRIARVKMRTMSLYESGESSGKVSLNSIMNGESFAADKSDVSVQDLIYASCRGGWPEALNEEVENPLLIADDYLESIVQNDIPGDNKVIRNSKKFRRFLLSLARNNSTIVKDTTIQNDVQSSEGEFAAKTLTSYLEKVRNLYILEEIPGWSPQLRSKVRLMSKEKRLFTDPSLAIAALGASPEKLLTDLQTYGGIFEGMCLRDLLVYSDANDARVFHYRDNSDLEIDAIVENRGGAWGAFEIKLNDKEAGKGAKSLLRLKDKIEKGGGAPPVCLAVITGTGIAMKREDGVLVIPITMLRE